MRAHQNGFGICGRHAHCEVLTGLRRVRRDGEGLDLYNVLRKT